MDNLFLQKFRKNFNGPGEHFGGDFQGNFCFEIWVKIFLVHDRFTSY